MNFKNINTLNTFDLKTIPDLGVVVLGALELFQKEQVPKPDVSIYKHPLIVGSGNAEATGRIIFENKDAVFASESNYEEKLKHIPSIDGVILISASGEKHALIVAKCVKEYGKHITLLTNTPYSSTYKELDHKHSYDEYIFPKNREPYTYNTSTYMGMILGKTGENPEEISRFISEHIDVLTLPDLSKYDKFFLIVPPKFSGIRRMLEVKFIELFGRRIARDVETSEYMKHAVTVVPSPNELFISFGDENTLWGEPENRLHIPLPKNADYGAMMAIGYYIIAQIQKQNPPYFKDNIVAYTEKLSTLFGKIITPIVENGKTLHQCKECGLKYADKEIAERCQSWCKEHKSCNLDIISHAIKNSI